ncbi:MAG TPA: dienelactone hydrolase family protein [Actinomycetota bacterium]|nr:dienelactone hydrolase family protein [Actinomycetota bacterium]
MSETRIETITAADGGTFDGHVWVPDGGGGAGVLLLQEIFGISRYIRDVAERLADDGYVVLAPDLYWRIEPGVVFDASDLDRARSFSQRFDWDTGVLDCGAAYMHLQGLPEISESCGVLGFCFGGSLAYRMATDFEPDAVVAYYGSRVPDQVDLMGRVSCPLLMHFGGSDPFIARERVARVQQEAEGHEHVEVLVEEDAGHAFDNHESEALYDAGAARRAWRATTQFLDHELRGT